MASERQHSRFGGSVIGRVIACPGSVALCDKAPDLPPTPESLEGTAAHDLIKLCLKTGGFDPIELVGRFPFRAPEISRHEVTPDMADAVDRIVTDVRADMAAGATAFIEYNFSLADFDAECWGTCDAVTWFPDSGLLRVRDYKHGVGSFVPVENNPQLLYYGLGAIMALGKPVKQAELWIYQPRHYGDGPPARKWPVSPGEIFDFSETLLDAVEAARKPDAPLVSGDHCQFCKARGMCPKLEEIAIKTSGADMIVYTGDVMVPEVPETMSADELGRIKKLAGLIRTWLAGVDALALAEMHRGNVATGFKPVQVKTHRRWKDAELTARQAARVFVGDLTEDDMFTRRIITPAALERLVGKKAAAEFIAAYTERPQRLTLVPVSDKREAVPVGALAEFEVIGENESEA